MDPAKIPEDIDDKRRRFLGMTALSVAAAELGLIDAARAQSALPTTHLVSSTSFTTMKQIDAGVLNVGYAEAGPAGGPVVILLHGWPYDIHSYVDVASLLAAAGHRVIVPYLRGYGRHAFFQAKRSAMGSNRWSRSMSSL